MYTLPAVTSRTEPFLKNNFYKIYKKVKYKNKIIKISLHNLFFIFKKL